MKPLCRRPAPIGGKLDPLVAMWSRLEGADAEARQVDSEMDAAASADEADGIKACDSARQKAVDARSENAWTLVFKLLSDIEEATAKSAAGLLVKIRAMYYITWVENNEATPGSDDDTSTLRALRSLRDDAERLLAAAPTTIPPVA